MIIIGALLLVMVISSAVVVFACMLSSQGNRKLDHVDGVAMKMEGRWSGTSFGGQYTTNVPHCSFEPEDLEDFRARRPF